MDTKKFSAKDFFLNLGATVALYVSVGSLLNLLFTVINTAYPQTNSYNYLGSSSISWPVAALIIVFPVFILLMWLMEKSYMEDSERRESGIHKLLSYVTLFLAGGIVIGDLVTVLYYFLDGQELTAGFLLKVLALLVISAMLFYYFISEIRGRLTGGTRKIWRVVSGVLVFGSIILGFAVLGSPDTQRLLKADNLKMSNLTEINSYIQNFFSQNGKLPDNLNEASSLGYYPNLIDVQTKKPYEYIKRGSLNYSLCAEFNKASGVEVTPQAYPYGSSFGSHPAGRHCFEQTINPNSYISPIRK